MLFQPCGNQQQKPAYLFILNVGVDTTARICSATFNGFLTFTILRSVSLCERRKMSPVFVFLPKTD